MRHHRNAENDVKDKIHQMVQRIVERFHPERVILFGSHARGTAGFDSDVDLLVVLPITDSKRSKRLEIRLALHDIQMAKDIIVATPEEFTKQQNLAGTIIYPAVHEGKTLYARA